MTADLVSVPETGVWDESRWDEHVDLLETALRLISDGSFPPSGSRDRLSRGQRRQLRDAMIFEAHPRDRRHLLVTSDVKGFIKSGRRLALEALGRTRIVTPDELEAMSPSDQAALVQ